ncbi:Uncharacterised protein [Mycobacteroides abscessus subsp. bolletii]|nr:Uncharacterised protein [Mycobacteroides abscessus subsp. bolletii]
MKAGVPAWLFLAMMAPPWNCWNTAPLSRVPALWSPVSGLPRACFWLSLADEYLAAIGPVSVTSTSLSPISLTSAGCAGAADEVVAISPTSGEGMSTLVPLLQPTVISATALRPMTALWRIAIVLIEFLSLFLRGGSHHR